MTFQNHDAATTMPHAIPESDVVLMLQIPEDGGDERGLPGEGRGVVSAHSFFS